MLLVSDSLTQWQMVAQRVLLTSSVVKITRVVLSSKKKSLREIERSSWKVIWVQKIELDKFVC